MFCTLRLKHRRSKVPKAKYKKVPLESTSFKKEVLKVAFATKDIVFRWPTTDLVTFQVLAHAGGPVKDGQFLKHEKTPEVTRFPGHK